VTIALASSTAPAYGTASATPSYPTGLAAGDLILMPAAAKPVTANAISWSSPSGWAIAVQKNNAGGYGTTLAADTGNTSVVIFYKFSDGTELSTDTVTMTPGGTGGSDCCWALMMRMTKTTGVWDLASTTSSDTSAGNLSLLMASDPGIVGDDFLVAAFSDPTNANTGANLSAEAMTCTGLTLGSVTEVVEPVTSLGNNVAGVVATCPVTSGDSAGNFLTFTATAVTGTNVKGPGVLLRLRENESPVGLLPFNGLSHHQDELTARRTTRRRSGLHVPRRDLAVCRAA
jgi:hypothetical protein